ncbi:hypothetical protein GDO78_007501 [Eleutherodactylus coqui]|uniref:Uncharacterized protein n=1 Tax=Eleutherodactylus coqui TaxID=57060 RepID=A0A8J6KD07_ELECQ|nr:hypothetical protein GDO78_007501 [Eleutherodactylus coqui]
MHCKEETSICKSNNTPSLLIIDQTIVYLIIMWTCQNVRRGPQILSPSAGNVKIYMQFFLKPIFAIMCRRRGSRVLHSESPPHLKIRKK